MRIIWSSTFLISYIVIFKENIVYRRICLHIFSDFSGEIILEFIHYATLSLLSANDFNLNKTKRKL